MPSVHLLMPGESPPRLSGRTRRDGQGTCVGKGQTKSDQGRKALREVCLHPHPEQGGTPRAERSHGCGCHFFLNTVLIVIKLNDPHLFPHQKQYPLKPKVKEWVKSYCNDFS